MKKHLQLWSETLRRLFGEPDSQFDPGRGVPVPVDKDYIGIAWDIVRAQTGEWYKVYDYREHYQYCNQIWIGLNTIRTPTMFVFVYERSDGRELHYFTVWSASYSGMKCGIRNVTDYREIKALLLALKQPTDKLLLCVGFMWGQDLVQECLLRQVKGVL